MANPPANPIDLTTIDAVCTYLNTPESPAVVAALQPLITGASQMFLDRTGLASLNSIGTFDEFYDGNGNNTLYLRQSPIQTVTAVCINGRSIAPSANTVQPGIVINDHRKSISIRGGAGGGPFTFSSYYAYLGGYTFGGFIRGIQNIEVRYTAGFAHTPYDVADKVAQLVAINFKRRGWLDQSGQSLQNTGATSGLRSWTWPPEVEDCLSRYQRTSRS